MLAFFAPAALRMLFGKALGNAATDAKAVGRWLGKLNFYQIVCIVLAILLVVDHIGSVMAHRQSAKLQTQLTATSALYRGSQAAFAKTVANYRVAAAQAKAADKANAERVMTEAKAVNERNVDEYEARIADADARYQRLRAQAGETAADPRGGRATAVPGTGANRPAPPGPASEDGFSLDDRYIATKQAIQLDQLIKAIKGVQAIDPNGRKP